MLAHKGQTSPLRDQKASNWEGKIIFNSASLQSRTALADTAGSAFTQQCEELIEADRFDEVLGKFVEHFGILFSKASQGDPTLPADAAN